MDESKRRTGKLIPDFDPFGMLLEAENFSSADLPCPRYGLSARLHASLSVSLSVCNVTKRYDRGNLFFVWDG